MEPSFTPSPRDVERYREIRNAATSLNSRMLETLPPRALKDVADALGLRRRDVLAMDKQGIGSVLLDACLFDWYDGGRNFVERYAEDHPPAPGTDEAVVLNGYLRAKYRLLTIQSAVPGAGVHCHDELHGEDLFLMDVSLSAKPANDLPALASRTTPLGDYWMANGAGILVDSGPGFLEMARVLRNLPPQKPGALPLAATRVLLGREAASGTRRETAAPPSKGKGLRHSALRPRYRFR